MSDSTGAGHANGDGAGGTLLVRDATYEEHRDYVLTVLSRRCGWLDSDEREAAFHDAYAVLLEKERDGRLDTAAMHPQQLRAYFAQTAIHKALDEGKRVERKRTEPLEERALDESDPESAPEDLAAASLDNARMLEIVGELPERAQTIVKLRFYFDRTPQEIQGYLGITERVYRRELERALRRISDAYQLVLEDSFCESRRSLILGYVAGISGPGRAQKAREHLASCPGCAHWAAELREAAERAAALLPMPAATADDGPLARLAETLAAVRDSLTDAGATAKGHLSSLAARVDATTPGYASAARPGTVAAAVAGCIAIGGGATYCAVEGLPGSVGSLVGFPDPPAPTERAKAPKRGPKPKRAARPAQAVSYPTPPPVQTTPEPTPPPEPQPPPAPPPAPAPAPAPEPAPPPPPPPEEFGLEGGGQPAATTSAPPTPAASSPAPSAPAPSAPPAPPGEFDP